MKSPLQIIIPNQFTINGCKNQAYFRKRGETENKKTPEGVFYTGPDSADDVAVLIEKRQDLEELNVLALCGVAFG